MSIPDLARQLSEARHALDAAEQELDQRGYRRAIQNIDTADRLTRGVREGIKAMLRKHAGNS